MKVACVYIILFFLCCDFMPTDDSKKNDPDGFGEGLPITFVIGEHQAIPGLEEGERFLSSGISSILIDSNIIVYNQD